MTFILHHLASPVVTRIESESDALQLGDPHALLDWLAQEYGRASSEYCSARLQTFFDSPKLSESATTADLTKWLENHTKTFQLISLSDDSQISERVFITALLLKLPQEYEMKRYELQKQPADQWKLSIFTKSLLAESERLNIIDPARGAAAAYIISSFGGRRDDRREVRREDRRGVGRDRDRRRNWEGEREGPRHWCEYHQKKMHHTTEECHDRVRELRRKREEEERSGKERSSTGKASANVTVAPPVYNVWDYDSDEELDVGLKPAYINPCAYSLQSSHVPSPFPSLALCTSADTSVAISLLLVKLVKLSFCFDPSSHHPTHPNPSFSGQDATGYEPDLFQGHPSRHFLLECLQNCLHLRRPPMELQNPH